MEQGRTTLGEVWRSLLRALPGMYVGHGVSGCEAFGRLQLGVVALSTEVV